MVELYYYDYPWPFHSTAPLHFDQSTNYWILLPNLDYLDTVRQDALKQGKKDSEKGKEKGKEKEEKEEKEAKKEEKKEEKKEAKKDDKKDDKKLQLIEIKAYLCCESCARKVRKKLENMKGVEKPVICDLYNMKVSVTATAKPEDVLKTVKKVRKDAEFWPQRKK